MRGARGAASRASWCGQLKLGTLCVPVKAYAAIATPPEIPLRQLHAVCGQRIEYLMLPAPATSRPKKSSRDFILDRLFGGNAAAKNACLDAVAAAVKEKPADSDRLFLLGVVLHFDGQDNRAAAAFARAEQTAGNNIGHIEAFMDEKE